MPFTLAEAALAQVQRLDSETGEFDSQAFVTKAADLQPQPQPENTSLQFGIPVLSAEASAPPANVSDADRQPSMAEFVTSAETSMFGAADPAIAPADVEVEGDRSDPAESEQPTQATLADLEDYILEPEATSFAQASETADTSAAAPTKWRATLWGGIMTNNDFEESLIFQGIEFEDSGLIGGGISRTLTGGNSIKLEGELQLLQHFGRQDHLEGTAALALRWELSPSFSVAVIEGVSYATDIPEIEDDNNTDESQILNYLGLEIEYLYTPKWGIAGRLHHRSGAFRLFGGAVGGSNAYLLGLRHRF
ncbi:MAG: hypothetical protein AAF827_14775 [Cyanobacteria bacterium P01_D01_bin.6]